MPLVTPLDSSLDPVAIFRSLRPLRRRIWLDSGAGTSPIGKPSRDEKSPPSEACDPHARYSFFTADPIFELQANPGDEDPWPELRRLAECLPSCDIASLASDASRCDQDEQTSVQALPPFQGGLAGIIGYESSRWIEPHELADCHLDQVDDLPTPAMSFGLFDWTIAIDHFESKIWLICQGWEKAMFSDTAFDDANQQTYCQQRMAILAAERRDQILSLIQQHVDQANESDGPCACSDSFLEPNAETRSGVTNNLVSSNFADGEFRSSVGEIVEGIGRGDSFQVNLAQRLTAQQTCSPEELYLSLRAANPAPQSGFYDGGSFHVLSSSPEGFLQIRDKHVVTRPIKGTRKRTGDESIDRLLAEELMSSEKERAENIMIVDLMRNDLSQVCTDESVQVTQLCQLERYEFVQHLVSVVEADLKEDANVVDCLRACFPGGSITGAPKIEAMKIIARLEPNPRGPYCGSMGYISCSGHADFNILIRTITATAGGLQIPVGGGITARSEPAAEEAETWAKAEGMLRSLGPYEVKTAQFAGDLDQ
ncbi:anthranilate synthase component I family protein [Stieleria sp. JC731]|uniref:anthranilate synthase component I family protein n=1 Tax=Pirellulaceae TaxID=2691357 RepID=UPI001E3ED17A|nr:anthranilate synthase component I family protein [Stieleria sp. JC731]MCC9600029.1 anthranilate synthase component I family protein [Stieleria sp. JC731]